uniref:Uncharacterized protein n=1 Tax=Myotis myotis TaxID=51298 RepID=A0A7J8AM16_MYOMY|nr:hypothetical protein mMyoMyo1_007810 [Myotis myotis]
MDRRLSLPSCVFVYPPNRCSPSTCQGSCMGGWGGRSRALQPAADSQPGVDGLWVSGHHLPCSACFLVYSMWRLSPTLWGCGIKQENLCTRPHRACPPTPPPLLRPPSQSPVRASLLFPLTEVLLHLPRAQPSLGK